MDLGKAQIGYDNQEPATWELTEDVFQASKKDLLARVDGADWVDSQICPVTMHKLIALAMNGGDALELGNQFKAMVDKAFDECAELLAQNLDY